MDTEYILTADGELYHWGTKGMKWGIRRYQNKDGSLTPAGKKKYAKEMAKIKEREAEIKGREKARARQAKIDSKKAELDARERALDSGKIAKIDKSKGDAPKMKTVKDMTDDELFKAVNRGRLESEYQRLYPKQKSLMQTLGEKALHEVLIPSAMNAGKSYLNKSLSKMINGKSPTVNDLLKKYGDMSDADYDRYKRAAAVKGWERTILGQKTDNKG